MGIKIKEMGQEFGRPDTERIGFFSELGYLSGKYVSPAKDLGTRDLKKRQMYPGGPKIKTDLQDCYFDQDFKRLFIGEGITKIKKKDENKGKPIVKFIPSKFPNPLYHPGDAYGYFAKHEAFSPKAKLLKASKKEPRGVYTSPGKLGGSGYADIGINKFPEYIASKYDSKNTNGELKKYAPIRAGHQTAYFDENPYYTEIPEPPYRKLKEVFTGKIGPKFRPSSPAKWDGGCKEGTLSKFPEYIEDRYHDPTRTDKILREIVNKKRKYTTTRTNPVFKPPACCKTWQCPSVAMRRAVMATHNDNWTQMRPISFPNTYPLNN